VACEVYRGMASDYRVAHQICTNDKYFDCHGQKETKINRLEVDN
jgi:hypothetical protein